MSVRKAMAGALIRLAHRIYRPTVTVEHIHIADPARRLVGELTAYEAQMRAGNRAR